MIGSHDREATLAALTGALPYVRLYKGKTFVIKLGGSTCTDAAALARIAEQISVLTELGIRVALVHGGGPQISALAERLGIETRKVDGRRVTDPATLQAAVMTLNGTVNTAILAACRAAHISAVGLSGVDAAIVRARLRPPVTKDLGEGPVEVDYGEVGDIVAVDRGALDRLLDAGFVPVMSPLAADDTGRVLNINADTVAAAVASALAAEKLIFLTDTPGILEDKSVPMSLVSCLDFKMLAAMEARGTLDGGMLPKTDAARTALSGGVRRVHVVGHKQRGSLLLEVFTNEGSGTLIVRDMAELAPAELAPAEQEAVR
jgi:acetylglutamate kinase